MSAYPNLFFKHFDEGKNSMDASTRQRYVSKRKKVLEKARCGSVGPDLFYPSKGGTYRKAKEICKKCSVIEECLLIALLYKEHEGVWGGLDAQQRKEYQKRIKGEQQK